MRIKNLLLSLLLVFSFMAPCAYSFDDPTKEKPHKFEKTIRVSGGGAALSGVLIPVHATFEDLARVNLQLKQTDPGLGLVDLLSGKADMATGAVPLDVMVKFAKEQGIKVDIASLRVFKVGTNQTLVMVNGKNKIRSLSKEQLKDIFTGKIANWKMVGGDDQEIKVVWGEKTPGQNALFVKNILDGEKPAANILKAQDYADINRILSTTPNAIGINPKGFMGGNVIVPEIPEVTSPVIVVTKGEPSPEVKKLIKILEDVDQSLPQ